MKQFLFFISKICLLYLLLATSLDFVYTYVFENSIPRNKYQYFRSFEGKSIDYVFLGSSRVENSIISNAIEKKTGKTVLNLGFQAAKMQDIFTLLQLIKTYDIQTKKVFIQIDYIYNIKNGYSNILPYEIMPYIRNNEVTKAYLDNHFEDAMMLYYFPFYRYSEFDSKIGFREFLLQVSGKRTAIQKDKGFIGCVGELGNSEFEFPNSINKKNEYFDQIQQFAKKNNIDVVYYCAPISFKTKNREYVAQLKGKIPELLDFSSVIKDDKMFKDCTHLNENGARFFTHFFIDNVLIAQRE
jgi:hypothetical protein